MRAQRRRVAVAARQVRVQKLLDEGLVDLIGRQPTPRHTVGEVGQGAQGLVDTAFGASATSQQRLERIDV
jgi:hypothetical protein